MVERLEKLAKALAESAATVSDRDYNAFAAGAERMIDILVGHSYLAPEFKIELETALDSIRRDEY